MGPRSKINFNDSVASIVRMDYRTADVFKKCGINYCCGGKILLEDACEQNGIGYRALIKELENATTTLLLPNNLQYCNWKTDFLVDYIINVHHAYLNVALPALETALLGFVNGHSKKYPELPELLDVFCGTAAQLLMHNRHEEEIIFPYIKQLENAFKRKESYGNLFVKTLRKPLSNIESELKKIEDHISRLRALTNNYEFPESACTNHQVIYHKLQELDDDLVQHKYLENSILFPKAIEIEQQLLNI